MQMPIETTFTNLGSTDDVKRVIEEEAAKLERVSDHIVSCRVSVDKRSRPVRTGNPYRVLVELHVPPRNTIVGVREPRDSGPHEPLEAVIKAAFHAARVQLTKLMDKQHGQVKSHPEQVGDCVVARLFREQGYGFIKTPEGRDIYFHRNSVLHHDFDRLEVGTAVRFEEEEGEAGPQASTVQIVGKPGARVSDDETVRPPLGWERG